MKVLITGGLGFVGSHLADHYKALGWGVTVLDNLTANVVHVDHPSVDHVLLGHAQQTNAGMVAAHDLVIHAASPVGAAGILPAQGTIAGDIVSGTQAVVDACIVADVPLINFSTSEVYGVMGTATEADGMVVPARYSARLEYQTGKIAAEQVVGASVARGLRAVQIRPWNMAGPREAVEKGFVIPRFVSQAMADEPLTVFGDGKQERGFTSIWDVARFLTENLPPTHHWEGQPYNVGNENNRVSIIDLAELTIRVCRSLSPISFTSGKAIWGEKYEEAAAGTKVPDSTLARSLGWEPRDSLSTIVQRTLAELAKE